METNTPDTRKIPLRGEGKDPAALREIVALTPDEVIALNNCQNAAFFKTGLPFGIACHLLAHRRDLGASFKGNLVKPAIIFCTNVLIGTLFYAPFCHYKIISEKQKAIQRQRGMQSEPSMTEDVQTVQNVSDDFNYPTDLLTSLHEPESNYSPDFSTFGLLADEDKGVKIQSTTYDDLRAKHRERYFDPQAPSGPVSGTGSVTDYKSKSLEQPPQPSPPRRVIKNKYGDEIE